MALQGYEHTNRVRASYKAQQDFLAATPHAQMRVADGIKNIINPLLVDRPLWEFEVYNFGNGAATSMRVLKDGETLGHVSWQWTYSGPRYIVANERIAAKRQRSDAYCTKDLAKALAVIKRMFNNKTLTEQVEAALAAASASIFDGKRRKTAESAQLGTSIKSWMIEYVQGPGREAFTNYIEATDVAKANTIRKHAEVSAELEEIDEISTKFTTRQAVLVLRNDSVYTVKLAAEIKQFNVVDLPEFIARRIGMLKLVEPNHFVVGCGFRQSENVFVVLNDEES